MRCSSCRDVRVAEPLRFRVRYRLSVAGGVAMQEANGLYISIEEHEAIIQEAARIVRFAIARRPLAITDSQARDAHRWLAEQNV